MIGMIDVKLDRRNLADADASCSDVDAESDWIVDRDEPHLPAGKRRVGATEAFHRGRRKKVRGQEEEDGDREMMVVEDGGSSRQPSTQSLGGTDYRSNGVHDDMSTEEDRQSRPSGQRLLGNPQPGTGKLRSESGGRDKETLRADYKILHARYTKLKGRHSKLKAKYAKLKAAHTQCLVQKLKRSSRHEPSSTHGGSSREQASSSTTEVHDVQQTFVCSQLQRFDLSS
jgi:hypothetical protein